MSLILPFIMCGGSGTRMWPVSRESLPKQFIPLLDERSTFQTTLAMLARPELFAPPCVITNRDYRFLVGEQMQSVGVTGDKPPIFLCNLTGKAKAILRCGGHIICVNWLRAKKTCKRVKRC